MNVNIGNDRTLNVIRLRETTDFGNIYEYVTNIRVLLHLNYSIVSKLKLSRRCFYDQCYFYVGWR